MIGQYLDDVKALDDPQNVIEYIIVFDIFDSFSFIICYICFISFNYNQRLHVLYFYFYGENKHMLKLSMLRHLFRLRLKCIYNIVRTLVCNTFFMEIMYFSLN